MEDYYTHMAGCNDNIKRVNLKDIHNNMISSNEYDNIYGPEWMTKELIKLLTNLNPSISIQSNNNTLKPWFIYFALQASHIPSEAPDMYYNKYKNNGYTYERQMHQAQTTSIDDIMKTVVNYLEDNDMWENTLIVFSSDNGGYYNVGDNAPLRGCKATFWDGGLRVPGFVTGGYLNEERYGKELDIVNHITDWYPTLLSAAGLKFTNAKSIDTWDWDNNVRKFQKLYEDQYIELDGIDLWEIIQNGYSKDDSLVSMDSREILLDMDSEKNCDFDSCGAIRIGDWKYVRGNEIDADMDLWNRDFSENADLLQCGNVNLETINSNLCRGTYIFKYICVFSI